MCYYCVMMSMFGWYTYYADDAAVGGSGYVDINDDEYDGGDADDEVGDDGYECADDYDQCYAGYAVYADAVSYYGNYGYATDVDDNGDTDDGDDGYVVDYVVVSGDYADYCVDADDDEDAGDIAGVWLLRCVCRCWLRC